MSIPDLAAILHDFEMQISLCYVIMLQVLGTVGPLLGSLMEIDKKGRTLALNGDMHDTV